MIGKVREDAHGSCLEARALLLGMPSTEAAKCDESEQGEGCQTWRNRMQSKPSTWTGDWKVTRIRLIALVVFCHGLYNSDDE